MSSGGSFTARLNCSRLAIVAMAGLLAFAQVPAHAALSSTEAPHEIAQLLADQSQVAVAGEKLDGPLLHAFYVGRQWQPAWSDNTDALLAVLESAPQDGISIRPLHVKAIKTALASGDGSAADILLTDSLLAYARAMSGARIDPTKIEDDWFLPRKGFDSVAFLAAHQKDILSALAALEPTQPPYLALRAELARLHAIQGDWPKVPLGAPLHPGDSDPRVLAVRLRLAATGEWQGDMVSPVLDSDLVAALHVFQARHGLTEDGALGPRTVGWMNVSPQALAVQVALNMERWRWLPKSFEPDHILVNVPAQALELVVDDKVAMTMKVVVGDVDHPTPGLKASMVSLVFNPVWRVPSSIATKEILPHLKQDPGYLAANDLELVSDSFAPGSPESQGAGIDWRSMHAMPWPVRQRPGADNALGRIKFNMPNFDDIYLHDTPEHKLFARAARAFSHGCVRVEDAVHLALTLLQSKMSKEPAAWDQPRVQSEIDEGDTHAVGLAKPLPVWLVYFTAWVDGEGVLQTRDDLYGRDHRLSEALSAPPNARLLTHTVQAKYCDGCRMP